MPSPMPKAAHPAHPLPSDISCEKWAEAVPPQPYCLMANIDPTLEEQILYIPQRERIAHIHHHDGADHLGRLVKAEMG